MRSLKLAAFALLGVTSIVSLAQAQMMNGATDSGNGGMRASTPLSTRASNIGPADMRSSIAPALPTPPVGDDGGPGAYLRAAHDALVAGRTGEAQQSLEMAETRALARSVPPEQASMPDPNPAVSQIRDALHVLGDGNGGRALEIIDAMAQ